jgi:hypothetical protein
MILDYAGYSTLANTVYPADSAVFYANVFTMQFPETITFGDVTTFTGYKHIDVTYEINGSILIGYLYVPESLETKFVFGNSEKVNGDFDLSLDVLKIYTKDSNIYIKYVS